MSPAEKDIHFKSLVDLHQEKVRNTCLRFAGNAADAEDLTQDVFIQVYESLHHFREEAEISTWIYRIAVNKSLDFVRRRSRRNRIAWLIPIPSHDDEMHGAAAAMPSSGDDPLRTLEDAELRHILNDAIARLPEKQRTVIILGKFESFSGKEIAAIMNMSLSSVEALMHRAKRNLHALLEKYFRARL